MTTLLIVEGSPPDILATGHSEADGFERTIKGIAPETDCRVVAPYSAPLRSDVFAGADGIIFTGSGGPWAIDAPEVAPLRKAMEMALKIGLPVWGSCNGMQLAAVVLGGKAGPSPKGIEIGVTRETRITPAGRAHPMMAGRQDGFAVPCMHRDEVQSLPDGAVLVASNTHCPVQAMAYARNGVDFWGTQYHPELSTRSVAGHIRRASIYAGFSHLADDLDKAETDVSAAARLGTTPMALTLQNRACELVNWLAHVGARKAERATAT